MGTPAWERAPFGQTATQWPQLLQMPSPPGTISGNPFPSLSLMMTMGHSLAQMPSFLHLFSSMIRSPIRFSLSFLISWKREHHIRDKSGKVKELGDLLRGGPFDHSSLCQRACPVVDHESLEESLPKGRRRTRPQKPWRRRMLQYSILPAFSLCLLLFSALCPLSSALCFTCLFLPI